MNQTISIRNREYKISKAGQTFILNGKRNAVYGLFPFANNADRYFAMDCSGNYKFNGVEFAITDGKVEIVKG